MGFLLLFLQTKNPKTILKASRSALEQLEQAECCFRSVELGVVRKEDPARFNRHLVRGSSLLSEAVACLGRELNSIHIHLQDADKYVEGSVASCKKVIGRQNAQLEEARKKQRQLEEALSATQQRLTAAEQRLTEYEGLM